METGGAPLAYRPEPFDVFFNDLQCLPVIEVTLDETGKSTPFPGTVKDGRLVSLSHKNDHPEDITMKKIVAINASPRTGWNTATLIRDAAAGAEAAGAEVTVIDLYRLEKFTGCVSCFGCKLPANLGRCVCRDGLTPVLDAIRQAHGLILGSPNYLGDISAGLRALYERLIFQSLSYKLEPRSYNDRQIPVLFIMTSNASEHYYDQIGYDKMLENYQNMLTGMVGPTKLLISSDTLQVNDYDRYNWTMFDPAAKKARHETVLPQDREKARTLGQQMVTGWD